MLKDMLVYLEGHSHDEVRLAYAEQFAAVHEAFVTGLYTNILPEIVIAGDRGMAATQIVVDMQENAIKTGDETEKSIQQRFEKLAPNNELRRIDIPLSGVGTALAAEARCADVFVATRLYGHPHQEPAIFESVLFNSGRACLFVPPETMPKPNLDTVMVAWRNTRDSARALAEAMPLLQAAKEVIVAMVVEDGAPEKDGNMPGADISRHLSRHGVNVDLRQITGWSDPAEALLNEAEKSGARMLVMGGYGHSRFRQWILGGVTRNILSTAEIPVLMAH